MYLIFDLKTRELINYSDTSEYSVINENKYNIVYFDDNIVIIKEDAVDFVESYLDESLNLSIIVPGQYVLSEDIVSFIKVLERVSDVKKLSNQLIEDKLKLHKNIFPLSYFIYMGNLALKNEVEYTDNEKQLIFHGNKDDYVSLLNGTMKLYNSIEGILGNFNNKLKTVDTKENVDAAFNELKQSLNNL